MLLSAAVTGEGLVSSASLVRGVLPNRQVPTPSGEGNVMADATQREPVRGPEPVAKRATKNSDPAGWWLVSALQGLKRLRSTIWCSSTPLEVLTDLCDGLGCVCVSHIVRGELQDSLQDVLLNLVDDDVVKRGRKWLRGRARARARARALESVRARGGG